MLESHRPGIFRDQRNPIRQMQVYILIGAGIENIGGLAAVDGQVWVFDVSFEEGLDRTPAKQWMDSRGALREVEEFKIAKYRTDSRGVGHFAPVVLSPVGGLGRDSRSCLAQCVGAECGDDCPDGCMAHGQPHQVRELRRVLTAMSCALVRSYQTLRVRSWASVLAADPSAGRRMRRQASRLRGWVRRRRILTGR